MKSEVSICWMRRDLRLNDQTALYHALNSEYPVLLVFIFDTLILDKIADKKDRRVKFIHQALENINKQIIKKGSSLYIIHADPLSAFQQVCDEFSVKGVFTNHDYEPYATDRDRQIAAFLDSQDIPFKTCKDQVIFERSEVMKPDGSPYTVFTPYSRVWKQQYLNSKPSLLPSEELLDKLFKTKAFPFPSLEEIGFENIESGIKNMEINEQIILHYHDTRNIPSLN